MEVAICVTALSVVAPVVAVAAGYAIGEWNPMWHNKVELARSPFLLLSWFLFLLLL